MIINTFKEGEKSKMKLNSLYKFYQKHFNYTSKSSKKQKIMYAYAISDAVSLLREIYELKEYNPLIQSIK